MQEPNNIREDLDLFNQISDLFLQDELDSPVANYISPENLLKDLDLSLNDNPSVEEEFKKTLKKLILSTPKSSSKHQNQIITKSKFLKLSQKLKPPCYSDDPWYKHDYSSCSYF